MTTAETIATILAAQRALLAYFDDGGPDTPIRTTWPGGVECWELPAADLRPLLDAIEASAAIAEALGSSDDGLRARVEALAEEWEHRYEAGDHMLGCPDGAGYYDLLTDDLRAALAGPTP